MKTIIQAVINFKQALLSNNNIRVNKFEYFNSPANSNQLNELEKSGKIEKSVLDFYRVIDGLEIDWEPVNKSLSNKEIIGRVKILPFQQVVSNWSGVVYFDDEPENTPRRNFFPTDFFADEAAAGFCTLEGYRNMMYLFKFEGDLIPLMVKFSDYLTLMLLAKGCYYWQYLILEIMENDENEVSKRIKQFLPEIFTDFSFSKFAKTFNQVRLR